MTALKTLMFSLKNNEVVLPVLRKFLLNQQNLVAQGKKDRKTGVIRDAKLTIQCFKTRIEEFNHGDEATKNYFHPSAIGQCLRKLWFREVGAPDNGPGSSDDALRSHLIFEFGTYVHVLLQNVLHRAGVLEAREVAVLNKEHRCIGHADGILNIRTAGTLLRAVLEIKSINNNGWMRLSEPKQEHKDQAMLYMGFLGLSLAIFLYFNKDTSQIKEYSVPFNRDRFNVLLKRISSFHSAVKTRTEPDREGKNPSTFPCAYCEYSKLCFSSIDHAKFMAKLKKSPKFSK